MLEQLQREMCKFGTDQIFHFGRPLTSHLVETGRWLEKRGNPRTLVAAGAFHSIYGTEEFREKAVSLERRPEIQQIIGEEAEALVYLFCLADRGALFSGQAAVPCSVPLPSTGTCVDLDEPTFAALLELEAANIGDGALHQPDAPPAAGPFWLARFESVRLRLSEGAYRAVCDVLTNWTADEVHERMRREGWLDDSGL
ncbi:hypothetical protein ParKJ_21490 [Paraburkholderia fungorum]|uniref:DUF6817 domain-containing protein n=1 Tax=Paraburkholderia fungorum TaxID=134537 RepID=A0AAP5QAM6_9BURK|nr:hypothetical protein [Paraburkholderia fungorum]MDT8840006.1 hypothetical protein [Paraburkholderia fungorum]